MEEAGYKVVRSPKTNSYMRGWFCPECFDLYRNEFGYIVDPDDEQWQAAGLSLSVLSASICVHLWPFFRVNSPHGPRL
jgi:hypothetical protein